MLFAFLSRIIYRVWCNTIWISDIYCSIWVKSPYVVRYNIKKDIYWDIWWNNKMVVNIKAQRFTNEENVSKLFRERWNISYWNLPFIFHFTMWVVTVKSYSDLLNHYIPLVSCFTPWKYRKNSFLMFSGGT